MITPFEIYLVLQMDDVKDGLTVLCALTGLTAFFALFVATIGCSHDSWNTQDTRDKKDILRIQAIKWFKSTLVVAALSALAATLLPSTKTLAAMLVIPAIANNETVQQEASELYKMAKEALKEAIKP